MTKRYMDSETILGTLQIMIELDGQVIGGATYFLHPISEVNLGLMLSEKSRGNGIGKLTMKVLIQLGHQMGIEKMELRTMRANKATQTLMESLDITGRDEIKEMPGVGDVAEILYTIPEKVDWEDLDTQIEFGGRASE
jgi:RimJ/RimL family protein N-acetyltransferase